MYDKNSTDTARILHVSTDGSDGNDGSTNSPLRNIASAADIAQPGDTVRVHAGIYRESITPPRGGTAPDCRITYEAAEGEDVEIRGSEIVEGWEKEESGIWRAEVSNEIFGDYNPFAEPIQGDWFHTMGGAHHTGCLYLNGNDFLEATIREDLAARFWYAEVHSSKTIIWANFFIHDPNVETVEINARPTIFYPQQTGIDYITVRGFTLCHAATNWAPPTAEQVGLIGTNWSKGWIIENNKIHHSRCVGVTLGKYGDAHDNKSAGSAEGYVETIKRALENGWDRELVGSHIVRHNDIGFCEQAGIVGSLGAIYSAVTDNVIHDIHVHRLFRGEEQAGIKFHAPIDSLIANNRIFKSCRAIWLDWMTQGTRITGNLCYENDFHDLFVEVNHGPYVVDNNVFLSPTALLNMSEGGAFLHNLFGGTISWVPELGRETPYHPQDSLEIAGITSIRGGDDRYFNNLFLSGAGLARIQSEPDFWRGTGHKDTMPEGKAPFPNQVENNQIVAWAPKVVEEDGKVVLKLNRIEGVPMGCPIIASTDFGETTVSQLPFKNYDGSELQVDTDFFGNGRDEGNSVAGPFVLQAGEKATHQL